MSSATKIVITATLLLSLAIVSAAQNKPVVFEVISVKRGMPGQNGMTVSSTGNRFRATNTPLKNLILNAYPVHAFQIVGGPNWMETDGFDIEAVAETPLSVETVHQMLSAMLRDRFKLELHNETRQMPLYALVVGKDGTKLQASKDGERTVVSGGGRGRMNFQRVSLSNLAENLSFMLDRLVIDQTGLTGNFTFKLEWTPDSARDTDSTAPSLFTAVQEQLGLKLESTKGPIDVLVIDSVSKPSEN